MEDEYSAGRTYDQVSTHCSIGRHYGRCQDESGLRMLQHGQVCMCRCHDLEETETVGILWENGTFVDGACVAFGLMGMAEAIRVKSAMRVLRHAIMSNPVVCSIIEPDDEDIYAVITRDLAAQADQWAVFKRLRELGILTEEQYRKLLLMA